MLAATPVTVPVPAILLVCLVLSAAPLAAAPSVVASIAPLHSLVAAVMGGVGTPRLLLRGGESPHTFSLRPSDARMLHDADVLFWIGPALEVPLQRILPGLGHVRSVAMLDAAGIQRLPVRELDEPHTLPGDDHPAHEHDRDGRAVDPHIWLSPANAIAMAEEIARTLTAADPANASHYRENATRLVARLHALDRDLGEQLAGIDGGYAVFHDAYQYLERRYGLHSAGTLTTHPERSPGAAHLRSLQLRLATDKVRCLFSEPQYQTRLLAMLGQGLELRHAVLDPLGADITPGPEAYETLMRAIGDNLSACLRGAAP
ncbi:MAG: zinc ABC transporter substrate-binding protein [Chromatiaceae bacterium]|nr:zinc ABC transporter substrate-binding protein [Chromatiaceae bacterium]